MSCTVLLEWVEGFLACLFAPFGWVVRKERLIWVSLCSGLLVSTCLLFSKNLKTDSEIRGTLLGSIVYLLLSTAFHNYFSQRITAATETFTQSYVTLTWVLRSVLTMGVSVCVVILSAFVERMLRLNLD